MGKRATIEPKPRKGDLCLITWRDFTADPVGSLEQAEPAISNTPGYYWEVRKERILGQEREFLITRTTRQTRDNDYTGYDTYPLGEVIHIMVVVPREEVTAWENSLLGSIKEETP
jgi:hypothetical protein